MEVLSDDATDELAAAVHRIAGMPIEQRVHSNKDLGETMVIAHAVNGVPGRIDLISTLTVLKKAAGREHLPDKASMRVLYERLRKLDDGLAPLATTGLMDLPCWS